MNFSTGSPHNLPARDSPRIRQPVDFMRTRAIAVLFLAVGITSPAAIIKGTVVEKMTGYSLTGASVTVRSLTGESKIVRSGEAGEFEIGGLASGAWTIKVSRRGFLPAEYGQRRWNSAGTTVFLEADSTFAARLQLSRFGGITGTVRDANEAGIPDQDVAAYSTTQPPHYVTRARSDDRGVYRIGRLEPGTYLVRTAGNGDENRAYLPTFSRQTLRVEEARPVTVYPDEDARDNDVRPIPGKLFELSGAVPLPSNFTVTVTLASETGRIISSGPGFRFTALAPGNYEIYAEARESPPGNRLMGGYSEVTVSRDMANFALRMNDVRESVFTIEGGPAPAGAGAYVRRVDLAGYGQTQSLALTSPLRALLFPGRWEFMALPGGVYYVSRFSRSRGQGKPEGWNEIMIDTFNRFTVALSTGAGAVHGTVKYSTTALSGAPVFLEAWDPATRKRALELRETRTDMKGNYRFDGLPPGEYRVCSTFEFAAPDSGVFDAAQAHALRVERTTDTPVDLDLYGTP